MRKNARQFTVLNFLYQKAKIYITPVLHRTFTQPKFQTLILNQYEII